MDDNNNFLRAVKYGSDEFSAELRDYNVEIKKEKAKRLINFGHYGEACDILENLDDAITAAEIRMLIIKHLSETRLHQSISFGNYYGPIEWYVIEKNAKNLMLISKYAIECKKYNDECNTTTWENSYLRKWLNEDFFNTAFNVEEMPMIMDTYVEPGVNPDYDTDVGIATTDKIFLLSLQEMELLLEDEMKCKPRKRAIDQGINVNKSSGCCWWWLRSPGYDTEHACRVDYHGKVYTSGFSVFSILSGVRSVMRIKLGS